MPNIVIQEYLATALNQRGPARKRRNAVASDPCDHPRSDLFSDWPTTPLNNTLASHNLVSCNVLEDFDILCQYCNVQWRSAGVVLDPRVSYYSAYTHFRPRTKTLGFTPWLNSSLIRVISDAITASINSRFCLKEMSVRHSYGLLSALGTYSADLGLIGGAYWRSLGLFSSLFKSRLTCNFSRNISV